MRHSVARAALPALWVAFFALLVAGCGGVGLVSDYDVRTERAVDELAAQALSFYDGLLEKDPKQRSYAAAAQTYGEVETKMRVLLLRQEVRPLHAEAELQARNLLEEWQRIRARHREEGTYPDVLVKQHRSRLERYFVALLRAEKARQSADASKKE